MVEPLGAVGWIRVLVKGGVVALPQVVLSALKGSVVAARFFSGNGSTERALVELDAGVLGEQVAERVRPALHAAGDDDFGAADLGRVLVEANGFRGGSVPAVVAAVERQDVAVVAEGVVGAEGIVDVFFGTVVLL